MRNGHMRSGRRALLITAASAVVIAAVVVGLTTGLPGGGGTGTDPDRTPDVAAPPPPAEIFPGGLYTDTTTDAAQATARLEAEGDSENADLIRQISSQPTALWLGDWFPVAEITTLLAKHVAAAEASGTTLVVVTYAVPFRDCGGLSGGGLSEEEYLVWNRAVADALTGTDAAVLVEPDSLAMINNERCEGEEERRLRSINGAVDILSAAGLPLYLDAGNNNWVQPEVMADLLERAGIDKARGFFTNVSNFYRLEDELPYTEELSELLGGANYVIDVSRNGTGWQGHWCNPWNAAIGEAPRVAEGDTALDALLWVKHPGQSDGTCNGGPPAGKWWESYAVDLVLNRAEELAK